MLKLATTVKEPNSITACDIVKHYTNLRTFLYQFKNNLKKEWIIIDLNQSKTHKFTKHWNSRHFLVGVLLIGMGSLAMTRYV